MVTTKSYCKRTRIKHVVEMIVNQRSQYESKFRANTSINNTRDEKRCEKYLEVTGKNIERTLEGAEQIDKEELVMRIKIFRKHIIYLILAQPIFCFSHVYICSNFYIFINILK